MDFTDLDPILVLLFFPCFVVIQFAPFVKKACGTELSHMGAVFAQRPGGAPLVWLHVSFLFLS